MPRPQGTSHFSPQGGGIFRPREYIYNCHVWALISHISRYSIINIIKQRSSWTDTNTCRSHHGSNFADFFPWWHILRWKYHGHFLIKVLDFSLMIFKDRQDHDSYKHHDVFSVRDLSISQACLHHYEHALRVTNYSHKLFWKQSKQFIENFSNMYIPKK